MPPVFVLFSDFIKSLSAVTGGSRLTYSGIAFRITAYRVLFSRIRSAWLSPFHARCGRHSGILVPIQTLFVFCLFYTEQQIAVGGERPIFFCRQGFGFVAYDAKLSHLLKNYIADKVCFLRYIGYGFHLYKR